MRHWLTVPDTDVEDWVQADISSTGKVLLILAHLDSLQPLIHWADTKLWGGGVLPAGKQNTHTLFVFVTVIEYKGILTNEPWQWAKEPP